MGTFQKEFLWGTSTSSHQVEGNNKNNWSIWEQQNSFRLAKEAKKTNPNPLSHNPENYISGIACEEYTRFSDDFTLAQSLGHNAHRFSIEWSRIQPLEDKFEMSQIIHYQTVIDELLSKNIEPFITLWHWTIPLWLTAKGGLTSDKFPEFFERYVEYVVTNLKNVTYWGTVNEPIGVIAASYISATWTPQIFSIISAAKALHNLASSHCKAYKIIHLINSSAKVGCCAGLVVFEPYNNLAINKGITKLCNYVVNDLFIKLTGNMNDFIGIQQYRTFVVNFLSLTNPKAPKSDIGWELIPESTYKILLYMKKYNKPMYITEHGLADSKDINREWFIRETLKQVDQAKKNGADVRGYFHWSLLDNFEWDKGFYPQFGLISVDRATMARTIRPSAHAYKDLINFWTMK